MGSAKGHQRAGRNMIITWRAKNARKIVWWYILLVVTGFMRSFPKPDESGHYKRYHCATSTLGATSTQRKQVEPAALARAACARRLGARLGARRRRLRVKLGRQSLERISC